jgi:hypothetical protein
MKSSVCVVVNSGNNARFESLSSRASSLAADLASYNSRASQPTSSPAVYASLRSEQAALNQRVQSYNRDAQDFASSSSCCKR